MMRWDGTRQGIQDICDWANDGLDPLEEPFVMYDFIGPADVTSVTVATDDGDYTELRPWGLILKTDDGFQVENTLWAPEHGTDL